MTVEMRRRVINVKVVSVTNAGGFLSKKWNTNVTGFSGTNIARFLIKQFYTLIT